MQSGQQACTALLHTAIFAVCKSGAGDVEACAQKKMQQLHACSIDLNASRHIRTARYKSHIRCKEQLKRHRASRAKCQTRHWLTTLLAFKKEWSLSGQPCILDCCKHSASWRQQQRSCLSCLDSLLYTSYFKPQSLLQNLPLQYRPCDAISRRRAWQNCLTAFNCAIQEL